MSWRTCPTGWSNRRRILSCLRDNSAMPPPRVRAAAFSSVFLATFALYAATACRTVGPGDSGELTVVMSTWGVAHAPGYPLMSLIGNLVSLFPFPGEPAFVLNLLTSLFGALGAAVLGAAVVETTGSIAAGVIA